tara:strand:- start:11756 stop:13561 length:1806 start_codon:yes stop_codon:yes gene_type:complete
MSILGEALGIDPQAFNRGAENQIKLQQLQRIEQERLDRMKLDSPMVDRTVGIGSAPTFDASGFGSPQVGVVTTPEVKVEKLPPIADTTTYVAPEKTETKKDEVVTTKVEEPDDPMAKIGFSGTVGIDQVDPESSAFVQDVTKLFANSQFQALMEKIAVRAAIGYGDRLAGSPLGRIKGYFTDNPQQALERSKSVEAADWFRTDEARQHFQKYPNQLTAAAIDPTGWYQEYKTAKGTTVSQITDTSTDKKDTKKTTDAEVVTEAQSANTGNTAKSTENVSSLQKTDGEVNQIVADTNTALFGTETVNNDGSSAGSNSIFNDAMYLANPSRAGQDTKYVLETRKQAARIVERFNQRAAEFARFAEIARLNGNFDSYEKYIDLANDAESKALTARASIAQVDQKLLYLQAMQGLNDLKFGNTAKAAMVWSMYSGRDVRIIPRTDGKFNITVDGEYYKTDVSEPALVQELRLTFDSNFRDSMNKLAGQKSMKLFEAGIDIQKELQKQQAIMIKEIKVQELKDKAALFLEMIKQANGEFKATGRGDGTGTVVINGVLYFFNPQAKIMGPDDKETFGPQLQPMIPPAVATGSGNAFVDALNRINKGE